MNQQGAAGVALLLTAAAAKKQRQNSGGGAAGTEARENGDCFSPRTFENRERPNHRPQLAEPRRRRRALSGLIDVAAMDEDCAGGGFRGGEKGVFGHSGGSDLTGDTALQTDRFGDPVSRRARHERIMRLKHIRASAFVPAGTVQVRTPEAAGISSSNDYGALEPHQGSLQ